MMFLFVTGEGRKRSQISLGNASEYALNVMEPDIVDLVGSVRGPKGGFEPCILKKSKDGHLCMYYSEWAFIVHVSKRHE